MQIHITLKAKAHRRICGPLPASNVSETKGKVEPYTDAFGVDMQVT